MAVRRLSELRDQVARGINSRTYATMFSRYRGRAVVTVAASTMVTSASTVQAHVSRILPRGGCAESTLGYAVWETRPRRLLNKALLGLAVV